MDLGFMIYDLEFACPQCFQHSWCRRV